MRSGKKKSSNMILPVITASSSVIKENTGSKPFLLQILGIEFVLIPKGTYIPGSSCGDKSPFDELPARQERIDQDFYMSRFEITQSQWFAIMSQNPSFFNNVFVKQNINMYNTKGVRTFNEHNAPVENISWDDTQEYLRRLNALGDGHIFRLPTELEWEYVATFAGKFKKSEPNIQRWAAEAGILYSAMLGGMTMPVDSTKPNNFGVYGMDDNVREWCQDTFQGHQFANTSAASSDLKVTRGNCWIDPQNSSRTQRHFNLRTRKASFIGFRIVLELNSQSISDTDR
jgi:formylglycine-generating enzyme required for sulfatase activity